MHLSYLDLLQLFLSLTIARLRLSLQVHEQTAIDQQRCPCHVLCKVTCQEHDRPSNVIRSCEKDNWEQGRIRA